MTHAIIDVDTVGRVPPNKKRVLVDGKLECPGCKTWKPLDEYHQDSNRAYNAAWRCKPCTNAYARQYHKEKYAGSDGQKLYLKQQRDYAYKRKYGLTLQEVESKFAEQGCACAICRTPLNLGTQRTAVAHVDHNHSTGAVRGILCTNCNMGLGHFKDDQKLLGVAAEYLKLYEGGDE